MILQAEEQAQVELTPSLLESIDAAIKALKEKAETLVFSEMTLTADDGGVGRIVPEMKKDYYRLLRLRKHIDQLEGHKRSLKPY